MREISGDLDKLRLLPLREKVGMGFLYCGNCRFTDTFLIRLWICHPEELATKDLIS
jgi:hypothetical protein